MSDEQKNTIERGSWKGGISFIFLLALVVCSTYHIEATQQKMDASAATPTKGKPGPTPQEGSMKMEKMNKTDEEWKDVLTPTEFCILRQKETERPYSGKYVNNHEKGIYKCAACGTELFKSDNKFDSGTGWPSFFQPIEADRIGEVQDSSHGMTRTEVICKHCGGHLGHVFNDGPAPSGLRYCINSGALKFEPETPQKK